MKTIGIILCCILAGLQYKLWMSQDGLKQWHYLQRKLDKQTAQNQAMEKRNQGLAADIAGLKSGDQALEEQARFELGMIKKGEEYYQFVETN
jgi:cell division protein FtsB